VKAIAANPSKLGENALVRSASVQSALAGLSLCMLLSSLGTSIANVGLPALAQAFSASFQQVQWVVLAYLLAITTLSVGVGRLGDLFGRRRLLLVGIALFTLGSAACGLASGLPGLIAARAVQGSGAAIMMTLSLALVGEALPKDRTGSAMGLLGTMSAVGTALGPSLGGVLIAGFGWRAIFLATLPFSVLAFAIIGRGLPPDRFRETGDRPRFDMLGTLLLAATLAAYALAMTWGRGNFGPLNAALLLAAAAGAGLFIYAQAKVTSPLIRLAMLREPVLRTGLLTNVLVATVMMTTLVVGPFYLAGALGLDAAGIGLAMAVGPVVSALSGVPAGRLVDRFGARRMTLAGLAIMILAALLLAALPLRVGIPGYIVALMVLTPGYALFQAANNTAVMRDIGPDRRGLVSGMLSLARNLGLVTGASAMGAVFAFASRADGIATSTPDVIATGMRITFGLSGGLLLLALAIAMRAGRAESP
jgi:MFS family permease